MKVFDDFEKFACYVKKLLNRAVESLNISKDCIYRTGLFLMSTYKDGEFVHCEVVITGSCCLFVGEIQDFERNFDEFHHGDVMLFHNSNGSLELTINVFNK